MAHMSPPEGNALEHRGEGNIPEHMRRPFFLPLGSIHC